MPRAKGSPMTDRPARAFDVLGEDYCSLHSAQTAAAAHHWLRLYTRGVDFGGWDFITIRDPRDRLIYTASIDECEQDQTVTHF